MLLPARVPPAAMSGTGCTLLDKEARRRRMSQVQVASVSARALADRGFSLLELTPNSEQERGHGACETLSSREAQIIRHLCRRHRFKGNLPLRRVVKKVIGIAAVVMNRDRVILLLRQRLSELRDQSAIFM
jgi:hypothetical protein